MSNLSSFYEHVRSATIENPVYTHTRARAHVCVCIHIYIYNVYIMHACTYVCVHIYLTYFKGIYSFKNFLLLPAVNVSYHMVYVLLCFSPDSRFISYYILCSIA